MTDNIQTYSDATGVSLDPRTGREIRYPDLKAERDILRAQGRCINGPRDASATKGRVRGIEHGPVTSGGKCARCNEVAHPKRKSK